MAGAPAKLTNYGPKPMPTLGGDQLYLKQELSDIANAINQLITAIRAVEARLVAGGL